MYTRYVELKQKKGVSDYAVSKATNIAASTFSDWKSGKSKPKIDKLLRIAEYFDVSVTELIKEGD